MSSVSGDQLLFVGRAPFAPSFLEVALFEMRKKLIPAVVRLMETSLKVSWRRALRTVDFPTLT